MNFILKDYNKYNNNIFQNTFLNNVPEETEGFTSEKVTVIFSLWKESRQ